MKNYVMSYCVKNQYEMIEEFAFKYSSVNYDNIQIMVFDDNSIDEQKNKLRHLCDKYKNITWVNPDVSSNTPNPVVSSFKCVDEYLTKNNIDVDWILFFENDCFPFQPDFWDKFDDTLDKHSFLKEKVGTFGFSSYQSYEKGLVKTQGSPSIARGNLVDGILNPPHSGWYKNLPDDYYNADYFVVEVPNWQSVCINRKLFRENIEIDMEHVDRLLSVDSIAHQFMIKGFFNIVFPKLAVYHDNGYLKKNIKLRTDMGYARSEKSHQVFLKRWGFYWGFRNKILREQFESNLSWWNDNAKMYKNSIQEKMFNMNINEGPKTIEDFNE
tara:strand:- start:466 stop:1443 length:978 start_codon:yes stop_codon:yes gene_type:complete